MSFKFNILEKMDWTNVPKEIQLNIVSPTPGNEVTIIPDALLLDAIPDNFLEEYMIYEDILDEDIYDHDAAST